MKSVSLITVLGLILSVGSAFAQTKPTTQTPPATQAKPQTPPATAPKPPAAPPAAAVAAPIVPLPEGSKIAFVNPEQILQESTVGKAASAQLKALNDKYTTELGNMKTQYDALANKLNAGGALLTAQAASQIDVDMKKLQASMNSKQEQAKIEIDAMQNDLMNEISAKVQPVIEAYVKEKGLFAVLDMRGGVVYAIPGMDATADIVKRLDAATKK
jgi:Skp family chaperone for outer membrane proteins